MTINNYITNESINFSDELLWLVNISMYSVAPEVPFFCEFTSKLPKFKENEHDPGNPLLRHKSTI